MDHPLDGPGARAHSVKDPGHEGYRIFLVDRHDENQSEMFAAEPDLQRGPIARIKIPLRLRVGVHGNWVPAAVFPRLSRRRPSCDEGPRT